jgi:hypothetical protein
VIPAHPAHDRAELLRVAREFYSEKVRGDWDALSPEVRELWVLRVLMPDMMPRVTYRGRPA